MRKAVDDMYTQALLLGLSTHREDISFYKDNLDKIGAAYQQARSALLAGTHEGRDLPGAAELLAKLKEAEVAKKLVGDLVGQQVAQSGGLAEGQPLELNLSMVSQIATNFKNEFDFWGQSVDALVEGTGVISRERQQRAQRTATVARSVQIAASLVALLVGLLAAWLIGRSVSVPIRQAVAAAERIAQGELAFALPAGGRDETGALMQALGRMQASLRRLVGEVRETAGSIEVASSEVAAGNTDLSQRTEHTAARLQSTTSSMTQIAGAARQSADLARTADALARKSAVEAEHGGEVVSQVVHNMQEIATQSGRIGEIIGVIDSIAFQTNILALNAAVEAARAGEQGRGFVVVANEVRGLAQRTADAAKDVKSLILASVQSVEQGRKLVEDAGQGMHRIVTSAHQVTSAITQISQVMVSQSEGISEVGGAVGEVDRLTQQNAALVEQSAAAAASLSAQAQRLSQAVAVFRLTPAS